MWLIVLALSLLACPLRQEIGLGQAQSIAEVEVFWPASALRQKWARLDLDRCHQIREGDAESVVLELKTFHLAANPGPAGHAHHHPSE